MANNNNGNTEYTITFEGKYVQIQKFDIKTLCKYNINFVGCAFENKVTINPNDSSTLFEYNKSLVFRNCAFKQDIDCRYVKTNGNIAFISTLFNGKTSFENTIFCGNEYKPFKEVTFFGEVDFSSATFEIGLDIKQSTINFNNEVRFHKTKFTKTLNIDGEFKSRVDFSEAIFEQAVCFNKNDFTSEANFDIAKFLFDRAKFLNYAKFSGKFNKNAKVSFKKTEFNEVDFDKIHFDDKVDFSDSKFNGKTSFNGSIFAKTPNFNNSKASDKINLSNTTFKDANFDNVKLPNVDFSNATFEVETKFKNTEFGEAKFEKAVFKKEVDFSQVKFSAISYFAQSKFESQVRFNECHFLCETKFDNIAFSSDTYFNNAHFEKYADFHESTFFESASFYNSTFDETPNFSTCTFKNIKGTNFINISVDNIDLESIERFTNRYEKDDSYINEIQDNNYKEQITLKHKIRYAKNARDSFRTIKDVLITNNNLLDAQNWHTLELYAKELELEHKKSKSFSKDWCDKIQLCFYRHTSEHHTDLLKIISWFVILVGGFAATLFISKYLCALLYVFISFVVIPALAIIAYKKNFFGFFTLLNLVPCAWLLTCNPKYIFGVANLFGNDKSQNDFIGFRNLVLCNTKCDIDLIFNLILSLYSIFFILLVFSLQKTARKNSIMPS
ncbi:pentapeptide repeat-containing protein [Helicobacter sp. T3_23-1056]